MDSVITLYKNLLTGQEKSVCVTLAGVRVKWKGFPQQQRKLS